MSEEIICNKCNKPMKNFGNISGIIYTSYPEQWDDVYACMDCKEKRTIRKHGAVVDSFYGFVNEFTEQIN